MTTLPKKIALFLATVFCCTAVTFAQPDANEKKEPKPTSVRVHGLAFGDYFYKIAGDTTEVSATQYSKAAKDFQAFQIRRVYLFTDFTFNESFAAQVLLEATDKSLDPGGRFGIFVKTAFVEWKNIFSRHNLAIGLIPTPSWALAERAWGYRCVEKTVSDMRGLAIPSDLGVSLRGSAGDDDLINYCVMIGNGTGTKPEANKFKKYYGEVNLKPMKELTVEVNGEFEPVVGDQDKTTLKGFVGYQAQAFGVGAEAVMQNTAKVNAQGDSRSTLGISGFAKVKVADDLNAFARFDMFDPDTKITTGGFKENFITAGLDFMPAQGVHIIPNVWVNTFGSKAAGITKDADLVARLTFFFDYK